MSEQVQDLINNDNAEAIADDGIEAPILALRGLNVFPGMIVTFEVERKKSIASLNTAAATESRRIFLVTQKDVTVDDPQQDDLYTIGTLCKVRQLIKAQDGRISVLVEGRRRGELLRIIKGEKCDLAKVSELHITESEDNPPRVEANIRHCLGLFEQYCDILGNALPETVTTQGVKREPGYIADYICQNMLLRYQEKQIVLETLDPVSRLKVVAGQLRDEIEVLNYQRDIGKKMHEEFSRNQRENYLREQLRVIKSELGENPQEDDEDGYREKICALGLEKEIEQKLLKEVDKLARQPFGSAEGSVIRSYLDTCVELPWNKSTQERIDLEYARKILDRDHFGLEKVKQRIIEYLAVKKLAPEINSPILCLVGPPGVGKTSVAISIATATNRKLARMSLGGVHDEADIRGHRKTYVGAMPGRIMYAINQAGSNNPLILLDEIDKLGNDFRGDPASALLEALDPEQNKTFRDHYLEIPFDLSKTMFITTANTTSTIPPALLDRMEIIEISSYTDEEKLQIAKDHLVPKQRKLHGISGNKLRFTRDGLNAIITSYTKESGVRQLEREIGAVCRKAAAKIADGCEDTMTVRASNIEEYLGIRKFKSSKAEKCGSVGLVNGLAWTSVGGEVLEVEAIALNGSGKLELTGNLGDVMKESAHAAVSYIRSRSSVLGIDDDFYKTKDIHLHFPEGAVPKDGPSAGISITIAVISALTGRKVKPNVAMTGEITLSGRILAIGGLKEKTMAALRSGIDTVIIPADNEPNLEEIDQTVRSKLKFYTISHADEALSIALED